MQIDIKDYVERILVEKEKATTLVAQSLELRLEHLNQLRTEIDRDRQEYVTKVLFDEHTRRLSAIESTQSRMIGMGLTLIALMGFLGFVAGKLFK